MSATTGPCPLCGLLRRRPVAGQEILDLDYAAGQEKLASRPISYLACAGCGTVSQEPLPDPDRLDRYYGSIEMERHLPATASFKEGVYTDRLELLRRVTGLSSGRCLEIGCGNAVFLAKIQREWHLEAWGIEPSDTYDTGETESGLNILRCGLEELDPDALPGPFDLVICRHVLEHVHDPAGFLDDLAARVAPRSWLYLEVPSLLLYARPTTPASGQNIHAVHLHHFTGSGLVEALRRRGLEICFLEDRSADDYPSLCLIAQRDPDGGRLFQDQFTRQETRYGEAARRLVRFLQDSRDRTDASAPVLIWGAGADLYALLPHLPPETGSKLLVHDRNPAKQGKTLGGIKILTEDQLEELQPRLVLAACSNHALVEDIRAAAASRFPAASFIGLFENDLPGPPE